LTVIVPNLDFTAAALNRFHTPGDTSDLLVAGIYSAGSQMTDLFPHLGQKE